MRREILPATEGWRGGKQKQVGAVASCRSCSSKWTLAAAAPTGDRQHELGKDVAAELRDNQWVG
jgi:hypothetical protein